MDDFGTLARDFGTALLLGALIGLEREKHNAREGYGTVGLRSFVLLAQVGAVAGYLGKVLGADWLLPAALLAVSIVVLAGYVAALRQRPESVGLTTELAALATCLLGALATTGHREIAVGLAVITAALLAYKEPLHAVVGRIPTEDVRVGMRLLLATFIVLPLLPKEPVDPWGAVVPHDLWLLVLLISGLSLVGYVASRWLGPGRSVAVTAAAGGLASSTAATLTFVKQSRETERRHREYAGGILLAWAVMFLRVLVAATVVCRPMFAEVWLPFTAMAVASGTAALVCLLGRDGVKVEAPVVTKNPFSLVAASKFALLFAAVEVLMRLAQEYLPGSGTYTVAAIAGLTDVDAITLTMAERARDVPDEMRMAVIAIVIAAASNTLVKTGMAVFLGKGLARFVLPGTGAIFAAGGIALIF